MVSRGPKTRRGPTLPYQICNWREAEAWGISVWYCSTHKSLRNSQSSCPPSSTCSKGVEITPYQKAERLVL